MQVKVMRRRVEVRMGEFGQGTRGQEKKEEKDEGMSCMWRKQGRTHKEEEEEKELVMGSHQALSEEERDRPNKEKYRETFIRES